MLKVIDIQKYDQLTESPVELFRSLISTSKGGCLIETKEVSFLGFDPIHLAIDELSDFKKILKKMAFTDPGFLPPFFGGPVGFLDYEAGLQFEGLVEKAQFCFQMYRHMIVFDHTQKTITVVKLALECYRELSIFKRFFSAGPQVSDIHFQRMVRRAKKYLASGDIFQVVLSRTFVKDFSGDDISLYQALKKESPSPYHYLFNFEQFSVVGASPERLLSVKDGLMETNPIAGTCLCNEQEEQKLLQDPKENAEHMMLVDLARNDLGCVAEIGSVKVKTLKKLQRFSHVSHLVSEVQAELKKEFNAVDALKAVFPAGTLSGAPKIRAMEIIQEIEANQRGLYGGALCFFDQYGNMESCLTIRTAILKDRKAYVRAGAGIVLDSIPRLEARETKRKAASVIKTLDNLEAVHATIDR